MSRLMQTRRRQNLSSIVWGTRRGLGSVLDMQPIISSPMNVPRPIVMGPISQEPRPQISPFPNPDTQPGVWHITGPIPIPQEPPPEIVPWPATTNQGGTGTPPVVVTPTSGPIPSPGTVAAGTAAAPSWLDESLIGGIPNKYLLLGGLGAFFFLGGKRK